MAQVREKYDSSGHLRRCQLPGLVCGQGGVLWQPTGSRQREEREFCHCQKLATSTRDQARQFCYQISAKELSLVLKVLDHVDFEFQRKRTKSVSVSHKRTINWNILIVDTVINGEFSSSLNIYYQDHIMTRDV